MKYEENELGVFFPRKLKFFLNFKQNPRYETTHLQPWL